MQQALQVYLLTPIEIVRTVLPAMRERGDGTVLLTQGISAIHPMPRLGALGPAMAAARNYMLALNAELADTGVFAGVVHVGAMVTGSAGHAAMTAGTLAPGVDASTIPQVDPADIAELQWSAHTKRDRPEQRVPDVS
jgi:short-subunit dehydrogenase